MSEQKTLQDFEQLLKSVSPSVIGFREQLKQDMRLYRFVCNLAERYASYREQQASAKAFEEGRDKQKEIDILFYNRVESYKLMNLSTVLKNARLKNGKTIRNIEEETGISNSYLSQLETGKIKNPSFSVVVKLCSMYKMDISSLVNLPDRNISNAPLAVNPYKTDNNENA